MENLVAYMAQALVDHPEEGKRQTRGEWLRCHDRTARP